MSGLKELFLASRTESPLPFIYQDGCHAANERQKNDMAENNLVLYIHTSFTYNFIRHLHIIGYAIIVFISFLRNSLPLSIVVRMINT